MTGEKNTPHPLGGHEAHSFILGSTGAGKGDITERLMKAEAARRGIPLEELIREMDSKLDEQGPSSVALIMQKEQGEMSDKRLDAVKAAFWGATPEEETYDLDDTLRKLMPEADEFTFEQKKALFMMLPATAVGLAIRWGLDDSEVRQEIYEFAEKHLSAVKAAMGLASE